MDECKRKLSDQQHKWNESQTYALGKDFKRKIQSELFRKFDSNCFKPILLMSEMCEHAKRKKCDL